MATLTLDQILRPSAFARITACPASITQAIGLEKPESSEAAKRGTTMHTYLEAIVEAHHGGGYLNQVNPPLEDLDDFELVLALFKQFLDQSRFAGCELVRGRYKLVSEEKLEGARVGEHEIVGTADLVLTWVPAGSTDVYLEIADLKTGQVHVPTENNLQLLTYAYLKIQKMKQAPVLVRITVLQAGEVRSTTYAPDEVVELVESMLKAIADNINKPDTYVVGDHCRYCPVNQHLKCPEQNNKSLSVFSDLETVASATNSLTELSNEQIQKIAQIKISQLEDFVKKVKALALERYQQNPENFPELKLVRSVTRRQVVDKDKLIADFGAQVITTSVKPIGELEKILGAETLEQYTVKPEGKLEVVAVSDRRQAVAELEIEKIFK